MKMKYIFKTKTLDGLTFIIHGISRSLEYRYEKDMGDIEPLSSGKLENGEYKYYVEYEYETMNNVLLIPVAAHNIVINGTAGDLYPVSKNLENLDYEVEIEFDNELGVEDFVMSRFSHELEENGLITTNVDKDTNIVTMKCTSTLVKYKCVESIFANFVMWKSGYIDINKYYKEDALISTENIASKDRPDDLKITYQIRCKTHAGEDKVYERIKELSKEIPEEINLSVKRKIYRKDSEYKFGLEVNYYITQINRETNKISVLLPHYVETGNKCINDEDMIIYTFFTRCNAYIARMAYIMAMNRLNDDYIFGGEIGLQTAFEDDRDEFVPHRITRLQVLEECGRIDFNFGEIEMFEVL